VKTVRGEGFEVQVPPDWARIEQPGDAFTLADSVGGVGALQISIAPNATWEKPSVTDLRDIIQTMAEANQLGAPTEATYFDTDPLRGAVCTYVHGEDFIRVWSVSDGTSFALATYVCKKGSENLETETVDLIVRSLRFSLPGVA
jgi:hypothetical protein